MDAEHKLPRDTYYELEIGRKGAIQVLWPNTPSGHQVVSLSTSTNRSTLILAGSIVELNSDVDCFVRFGDVAVNAALDDLPLWSKVPRVYHMLTTTHIAGIVASATGKLYITVLQ